jgi:hypothetical protein
MTTTDDTEEPLYEMQAEEVVPTMETVPVESDLSPPSMDKSSIGNGSVSHSESPPDGILAAGISNGSRLDRSRSVLLVRDTSAWISKVWRPGGLSFFTATCTLFSTNGASVYLPWAFAQGGTLFTSIVLGAVVLQAYIAASFILEASARAQALDLVMPDGTLPRRYSMKIQDEKYELSLLSKIFLGKVETLLFSITTLASMYGAMWAFCTVSANTFADKFPLGDAQDGGYKAYIVMFMVVAVPLACTSISDQQCIQVTFVMGRIVMILLMIITVAGAYGADEPHFGSQVGPVDDILLAKPSNIVSVTMTCIFASTYQFAVPTVADECRSKTELSQVFGAASTLSYVSNLLLGILLAIFFGQVQPDSANLNWVDYHGGTGDADPAPWATLISGYIVLFAAIQLIPQYTVVATPTGGTLMGAVYGDRVHKMEKDWRIVTAFRLLASIPPGIGALFLSDFSVIAKYTGVFTILSYTVCPALLALSSRACMKKKDLPLTTYYSSYYSSRFWSYGLLLLSAALIVGVAYEWF